MDSITGFMALLAIWGALYAGYALSMKRYQQGD